MCIMLKFLQFLSFILIITTSIQGSAQSADLIIFSFDRPLQFYALMESIERYVTGLRSVSVLYRVSSPEFNQAYDSCFERFKHFNIRAVKQGENPRADFKPLILSLMEQTGDYILFAVDDLLVKDFINLDECITHLEEHKAYGFYLRMGNNITHCYSANMPSPVPPYELHDNLIKWKFGDGVGEYSEWRYSNSLDMTLYRKHDLLGTFRELDYVSPNVLEMVWAWRSHENLSKQGICFTVSKTINVPLNLAQQDWPISLNMGYTLAQLLKLFQLGYRLNIKHYFRLENSAPHVEVVPHLIRHF